MEWTSSRSTSRSSPTTGRSPRGSSTVRDERIKDFVDEQFAEGVQWPDPWLSLNPSFASGGAVPELVDEGLLHPECARIFRRKNDPHDPGRDPIVLHRHQREAVEVARTGKSYVLTTGTGSGKSLAYIVPIVDAVLRDRDARGGQRRPGVKAIVVYPMNALANSQVGELEKFLQFGYPEGGEPVTFARYTGQESPDERAPDPRRAAGHPADQLRDARAGPDPAGRAQAAGPRRAGTAVPRARRAAHLPRPAGRRRRAC